MLLYCCKVCEMKLHLIVITNNSTCGSGSLANSLGSELMSSCACSHSSEQTLIVVCCWHAPSSKYTKGMAHATCMYSRGGPVLFNTKYLWCMDDVCGFHLVPYATHLQMCPCQWFRGLMFLTLIDSRHSSTMMFKNILWYMHIKLLAQIANCSQGCAQPSMHVYSDKCKGQCLQVSPCMQVLPHISVHRHGNDITVSASTAQKVRHYGLTYSSFWWLWFTCNSLTSADTSSPVSSSSLRLQNVRRYFHKSTLLCLI